MAKRLVKIAKELNVGTSTIVEFLASKGHVIDNKPTAKVEDDMYHELLKEFSNSMAVKEKADSLIIGTKKEETTPPPPPPPPPAPKPETPVVKAEPVKEPPKPEPKVEEAPTPEPVKKEDNELISKPKLEVQKPKILGKIDLTPKKKEKPKVEAPPKAEKAPEVKETPKPAETSPTEKKEPEQATPEPKAAPKEDMIVRAKTPTLKGVKVLGKINIPEKKKKEDKPKPAGSSSNDPTKRKRKRKKVNPASVRGGRNDARGKANKAKKDEVREVSKKEIEDKIKATMARISGGGRNKRQKIRRDNRDGKREKQEMIDQAKENTKIQLTEFISVSEFANLLNVSSTDVIMTCMNLGVIVSINQRLDAEIIELVAGEFEQEVEFISAEAQDDQVEEIVDAPEDLQPRAPIVTVMGHVDHGKTSLLDYIREANVASGEAGGITQHIGAYEVKVGAEKKKITFLDTPGHEAFTAMRARGAKVTDIVIIIVAADDRIMPQTKEAISHAQAAGVPIIFAINKIDKDGAQPDRIKQELAEMNFLVEEWGGGYQSQDISAKTGQNIEELLEKVVLESDVLELKANPDRDAVGAVLEASLDKGRGYVTKILVQSGTLSIGDSMTAGAHSGKVKAMFDERGKRVKKAGPSTPVLMLGLSGAPQAGEKFKVVESEQEARQLAAKRAQISREQTNRAAKRISLDEIGRRLSLGNFKELNLIVKGDFDGSVEALSDSLIKLSIDTVQVNVIHKAVGQIIESDVLLASASEAIIVGFQVRPSGGARQLAEKEGVEIKTYSIIYEAIDEIKAAIEGMLDTIKQEKVVAQVEVRETFKISKVGTIAGCYVQEGRIGNKSHIRLIRDGIVVYPVKEGVKGELSSLKRFKDDVKEVKFGFECGLSIKNFNDIKVGDIIEAYEIEEIKQTL